MLRTFTLAAAASLALGAAALTPTVATAHSWGGHHGGWHGGWGHRSFAPRFVYRAPVYAAYNGCLRTRWVATPWGPRRRVVNVCY